MSGKLITVIDESAFLRECVRRSLQSAFRLRILTYSGISDFRQNKTIQISPIVIFSCRLQKDKGEFEKNVSDLLEIEPGASIIVLGLKSNFISIAIRSGVRGYIPSTMKFQAVIEAVRVVLAGGTYMPMETYMPVDLSADPEQNHETHVTLTTREISVIQAIKLGKSNKIIAYNLGMTENTVKVHVRHIMSKLKARNRTEIAMMSYKVYT